MLRTSLLLTVLALGLVACDAADPVDPPVEASRFRVEIANVGPAFGVLKSGVFTTPVGASGPSPIGPGGSYAVEVEAVPGDRLSLATMFIQSNDLFYTFEADGLALFDAAGTPVSGDVTDRVRLYDAGTERNQEPGVGPDQAPRQAGPDTGADESGTLGRVTGTDAAGYSYPSAAEIMRVTVTPIN